jgi:hypothetical protein
VTRRPIDHDLIVSLRPAGKHETAYSITAMT